MAYALISKTLPCLALLSCSSIAYGKTSEAPNDRVNYPSNFQVEGGCNLIVFGDYLYWTASEDGLYFAQTGARSTEIKGKLKKIEPEWNSGAKVGIGLNFPKEGYDILAYWTWFASDGQTSVHGSNSTLLPLWAEPDFDPFSNATRANGKWNLDLNVFDLEWGRSSWFGGHFSLRPFFGLRGAWIDQDLKTRFAYAVIPAASSHMHSDADFQGGGLRAGGEARFALPAGFAIYSIASASLLYGELNGNLRIKENGTLIASTKDHFKKGISSVQLALGLGWDSHFAKDRLHIEFHVGWEANRWFGVNQMNHFMNQLSQGFYFKENGNLSTQGVTAGGRFNF